MDELVIGVGFGVIGTVALVVVLLLIEWRAQDRVDRRIPRGGRAVDRDYDYESRVARERLRGRKDVA